MKGPAIVIVGAGQGGFQLACSLRSAGFAGAVTLVGEEPYPPYQRPPLSKAYLQGKQSADALLFRQINWYAENAVHLRTNTRAAAIDRDARRVLLEDGQRLAYDHLVLATGARVRHPAIEGLELRGIFAIRTLDDADRLASALRAARSVLVLGGGFIGLEFAAVARGFGKTVRLVEAQERLMARAVPPVISTFFAERHVANGVVLDLGASVLRFTGRDGRVAGADLADGRHIEADLVVIGVGVVANDELAAAAGLACDQGIVVDDYLRTDDPAIFAVGDCVQHHNPFADLRMRVESVQNAVDQAKCVAAAIMGRPEPYRAVPWFWSDQYDLKLQMVGFSGGFDHIAMRGNDATSSFSAFYYRAGRLIGIDSVNRATDHMLGRRLLEKGLSLPIEAVEDETVDLKRFLG